MTRFARIAPALRAVALFCLLPIAGFAQGVGSAFTYQGELRQAGEPASAPHDVELRPFVDNPVKPTAGGFAAPSDARLKQHVRPLGNVLDQLLALRGVRFQYRDDAPDGLYAPGLQVGFIAQEVEQVFPDWVIEHDSGFKLVSPKGFDAMVVESLRELRTEHGARIEGLETQVRSLRRENSALHQRLVALEQAMVAALEFQR